MKMTKTFGRAIVQKIAIALLVGGFLMFLTLPSVVGQYRLILNTVKSQAESPLSGIKISSTISDNKPESKSICDFSWHRSDICEMDGDIRIHRNSSKVFFIESKPNKIKISELNKTWIVKPYPRKSDVIMGKIREVTVNSMKLDSQAPVCEINHAVPAVVFSNGGYSGNYYHDFNEVIIPLFITTYQFKGEVQLLVTEKQNWWFRKYKDPIKTLSKYDIIDLDNEGEVHCFPHAIVGLRSHRNLSVDPSMAPNGYSVFDFKRFIRMTYSLEREFAIRMSTNPGKKPRLLIITRKRTRLLTNIDETVRMAENLGFEVMIDDTNHGMDVAASARILNSCDVMVGVHGSGLTNIVFLPTNAVMIQIIPFGKLESLALTTYGLPAIDMNLKYLEYSITLEESSLIELYPRDHPVLMDPLSIRKQGWPGVSKIYLNQQNIKLNVQRFRPVLEKAMNFLRE